MDCPSHGSDAGFKGQADNDLFERFVLTAKTFDLRGNSHSAGGFDVFAAQGGQYEGTFRHGLQEQRAHVGLVLRAADQFEAVGDFLFRAGCPCGVKTI